MKVGPRPSDSVSVTAMTRSLPSPTDSRLVAFVREKPPEPGQIMVQPAEGGGARSVYRGRIQSISFGSGGETIFFTECDRNDGACVVKRLDLRSGAVLAYPSPPPGSYRDVDVAVSPDGGKLVFARYRTAECGDLFLLTIKADGTPESEARRITSLDRRVLRPGWRGEASGLVFVAGTLTKRSLWKTDLKGNATRLDEFGDNVQQAALSVKTGRLAVVADKEDSDLWRFAVPDDLGANGRAPERVSSSTALDEEPSYSPDGRQIAFLSERSGSLQAWVGSLDGRQSSAGERFRPW